MATGLHLWSKTAASNASADSSINWAEGQAPSTVNDSARAVMARVAEWRDDLGGITTGGSSTAYTVTTNRVFASAAVMANAIITIIPHTTSGADPTLAVDGLTARQIRIATGLNVPTGSLVAGTPYQMIYVHASTEFILIGDANTYNMPIGGVLPYVGLTAPNSNFVLAYGQAISRTTYAALFTLTGTTFGVGDGSTTFNVPDLRGRVIAGQDDMGGSSANRLTGLTDGVDGDTFGAAGGLESTILTEAQLAAHTHASPAVTDPGHVHGPGGGMSAFVTIGGANLIGGTGTVGSTPNTASAATGITLDATTGSKGSNAAHNNIQPTIILNYILRVL